MLRRHADSPSEGIRSDSGFAPLSFGEEPCPLSLHTGRANHVSLSLATVRNENFIVRLLCYSERSEESLTASSEPDTEPQSRSSHESLSCDPLFPGDGGPLRDAPFPSSLSLREVKDHPFAPSRPRHVIPRNGVTRNPWELCIVIALYRTL
jgi:hypothetical protein